jgi:phospholipase C
LEATRWFGRRVQRPKPVVIAPCGQPHLSSHDWFTLRKNASRITKACLDTIQPRGLFCYTPSATTHQMSIIHVLLAIAVLFWASASPTYAQAPASSAQIKHIVFILKENHTFDNYFGSFPGTDGATTGRIHTGKIVP